MNYFLQGFGVFSGVFLGIIAGTIITILVNRYYVWGMKKNKVARLKFELEFNIRKLNGFKDEIVNYRNAVNGDNLQMYFGYFDLSRVISVTANSMFLDGSLYNYLNHDDIGKLQVFFSEFSFNGENYINNQITQNKNNFVKQKAVADVNFWEKKFKDSTKILEVILKKLS